jgi:hypothetical protein
MNGNKAFAMKNVNQEKIFGFFGLVVQGGIYGLLITP